MKIETYTMKFSSGGLIYNTSKKKYLISDQEKQAIALNVCIFTYLVKIGYLVQEKIVFLKLT